MAGDSKVRLVTLVSVQLVPDVSTIIYPAPVWYHNRDALHLSKFKTLGKTSRVMLGILPTGVWTNIKETPKRL